MINCPQCGWVPVPEKDLPVKLPYLKDFQPKGVGASPLEQLKDWVKVACPECGADARRETDVSDTFLDSAWYFFRYPSTDLRQAPFDPQRTKKWLPVDMYIGGAEHTVLHLMYSRFVTMAFKDFGLIEFEEPYKKFYAHGLITKDGAKMSKSKGNVIIPDEYIEAYGADTLRMYLMFLGPFGQGGDFSDAGIEGVARFLKKVWSQPLTSESSSREVVTALHRLIKKVGEDIEQLKFNTAIAAMMGFINQVQSSKFKIQSEDWGVFLRLLAPFAPHLTEELWQRHVVRERPCRCRNCRSLDARAVDASEVASKGSSPELRTRQCSIHLQPWPQYDKDLLREDEITIVIQIDGKLRDRIRVGKNVEKNELVKEARRRPKIKKHLADKNIKKTYVVPGKLINFTTE
jgi:leucyl-tRNA synthetase